MAALRNAVSLRSPLGTVAHSDRGSQFRSNVFVRTLKSSGLTVPMGRVGACADNAAMKSFFVLLQKNVLDRQRWAARQEIRLAIVSWIDLANAIFEYIEIFYNRQRRHSGLDYRIPIEHELHPHDPTTQSA